jgi:hypothetical protein
LSLRCIGALVLLALFLLSGAHAQTLDQMQFPVQVSSPVLSHWLGTQRAPLRIRVVD